MKVEDWLTIQKLYTEDSRIFLCEVSSLFKTLWSTPETKQIILALRDSFIVCEYNSNAELTGGQNHLFSIQENNYGRDLRLYFLDWVIKNKLYEL